jgi:hypothetical protein
VKGILETPAFSAVPWSSLNKELISLAFGTGWLAIAGARKLVAARREARLNAWPGPVNRAARLAMLATIARDF